MDTWKRLNPGYIHHLYDDREIDQFMQQYFPAMVPVFQGLLMPVERADLWRYLVLGVFGGVYADSDILCVEPVDNWNKEHGYDAALLTGIEGWIGPQVQINQWVLASMPCHPVIGLIPQQMYQEIARDYLEQTKQGERISKEHYHGRIIHRTGPQAWTSALQQYSKDRGGPDVGSKGEGLKIGTVRILAHEYFSKGSSHDDLASCLALKK
eukprot:jgi/Chrzof1/11906/Cz06g14060.t1